MSQTIAKRRHLAENIMVRYPRHPFNRWVMRAAFSLPFIVVALISNLTGYDGYSENAVLLKHVNTINFGDVTLSWIADLFPLIPIVTASIVRSELVLGIFGALIAGWLLQNILETMRLKKAPMWLCVIILITFSMSPLMFFNAVENFGAFLGMATFGVAFINMVKFIENGSTFNGFRAGFFFLAASLSDTNGFIYLLMGLAALPMMSAARKGQKGAVTATLNVLLFPSIAAIVSIIGVNWIVAQQTPWVSLLKIINFENIFNQDDLFSNSGVTSTFIVLFPVTVLWLLAQAARKEIRIFFTAILLVIAEFTAVFFEAANGSSTGILFIILTILTLALLSNKRSTVLNILAATAAFVQFGCAWWMSYSNMEVIWPFVEHFAGLI